MFLNRPMYFAPDDEQGGGFSVEEAVSKLSEQRATQEKEAAKPKPEPKVEAPKAVAPVVEEPEEAPESDPQEESTEEKSPEEKLAAQLESEQATPAADTKLPSGWSDADRELWSSLTPEVQAKLEAREKARDAGIRKRLQEADSVKKSADTLAEQLKAERQRIAPILQSTQNSLLAELVQRAQMVRGSRNLQLRRFEEFLIPAIQQPRNLAVQQNARP